MMELSFGLFQRFFDLFGHVAVFKLSSCKNMTHSEHFLYSDNIFDSLWNLRGNDLNELFVFFMIAVTESWVTDILVEFAF